MSLPLPIVLCKFCDTHCEDREACREFHRYLIYEKIRKLENELYCLTLLLDK